MAPLIKSVSLTMVLIFAAASILGHADAVFHLTLKNSLLPGRVLTVRCKDMFTEKYLPLKQIFPSSQFRIDFEPVFLKRPGNSQFNCSILHDKHFYTFEFYNQKHYEKCGDNCCFEVKPSEEVHNICLCGSCCMDCFEPGWEIGQ